MLDVRPRDGLDEPCQRCGTRQAERLIGAVAHCHPCAEAFLAPLRKKWGVPQRGAPAPGHGDGFHWFQCGACGATWVEVGAPTCPYCEARKVGMDEDRKRALLFPSWAVNGNGPRYDALSDADKTVWRKTRGQTRDDDSQSKWVNDLANAVRMGEISEADAEAAIKRIGEM